jgi:CubicO group peptidase (beta-lactamase class C family)
VPRSSIIKRRAFLGAGAALAVSSVFSRRTAAASIEAQVAELAAAERDSIAAPGFAYGIVLGNGTILKRGLGVKELGKIGTVTAQTLFHMASVTKPFVATVLALRAEQGKIRLDQRLDDVLPELRLRDPRARSITIEQLLTHSSGLPDVEDYGWDRPETDAGALKRYLATLSHLTLLFPPGTSYAYSNIGFEILARVIEVLDGVPFEQAVRTTLLAPLKMNSSTLFYPEADPTRLARPHVFDDRGVVHAISVFPYNRPHAGSSTLISCIDDMLRWVQFNLNGGTLDGQRILAPATARNLRTVRPLEVKSNRYPHGTQPALSWFVVPRAGQVILMHGGDDLGFVSLCLFCPRGRYGMVAMANCESDRAAMSLRAFAFSLVDAGLLASAH